MPVITGALFYRNAPALCFRAHIKLYVLVHPDRDADHRQSVIGTVCPGSNGQPPSVSDEIDILATDISADDVTLLIVHKFY